jgi:DNA 3'-phosphatase
MVKIIGKLPEGSAKWALFDLDWTLIRPTTTSLRPTLKGGPFSLFPDDWVIIPERISRLKDFLREDFTIGIVTNQKFKGKPLLNALERMRRVSYFLNTELGINIPIMISTDDKTMANPNDPRSFYRKPGIGWAYHLKFLPGSLYIGDAVQNPNKPDWGWGHSNTDYEFAQNLGIPFYPPEEVFPQITLPKELLSTPNLVLILVGSQGSGKSTFAQKLGWNHIESDTYASNWNKIQKKLREYLLRKEKVIIDATNPSRARRMEIIQISREYNAPVGIILFLNSGKWNHSPNRKEIPKIAINLYWSNFEEPNPQIEGVPVYYQL